MNEGKLSRLNCEAKSVSNRSFAILYHTELRLCHEPKSSFLSGPASLQTLSRVVIPLKKKGQNL